MQHVVILLFSPLQSQSDTKVIPVKKSYVDDWWFFIGRFNVGSVSQMSNKEALVLFIYKPHNGIYYLPYVY